MHKLPYAPRPANAYSVAGAAAVLGCSRQHVRDLARLGRIGAGLYLKGTSKPCIWIDRMDADRMRVEHGGPLGNAPRRPPPAESERSGPTVDRVRDGDSLAGVIAALELARDRVDGALAALRDAKDESAGPIAGT